MNIASPEPFNERYVTLEGKKLLYFGGCDYLRLSHDEEIHQAMIESIQNSPSLSSGASRTTTGDHRVYHKLEHKIAKMLQMEDAILTGAGYLANLCLSSYLRSSFDGIMLDEHSHPSLKETAELTGLPTIAYRHADVNSAAEIAKGLTEKQRWILLSERMFGLDGSIMPLKMFNEKLPQKIPFLIDEAHSFGILNQQLKINPSTSPEQSRFVIKTISLAKTIGCHGGAIVAPRIVTRTIRKHGTTWAGHTPFPMHLAIAAMKSIDILKDKPELNLRLQQNIAQMSGMLSESEFTENCQLASPVISLLFHQSHDTNQMQDMIKIAIESGIYPSFIKYSGSKNQYVFRSAISSRHNKEDLQQLVKALVKLKQIFPCKHFLLADQQEH